MRNDILLKVFNFCFNDNLFWKLNFLILNWFTKFSMTSKLIMTRKLCLCESTLTYIFMKMWLTTSFFSIWVCKTKTMFTNFNLFSHIWNSFYWIKSSISIIHDFTCRSYNKSFRFYVCSTKKSFDETHLKSVRWSCVISAWFDRRV
jgi:hypothetical protein